MNTDTEGGLARATKYYQWIWVARPPLGFFFSLLIFSYFYFPLETCITYMLGKHMFHFFRFALTSWRKTEQHFPIHAKERNSDQKKPRRWGRGRRLIGDKMERLEYIKKTELTSYIIIWMMKCEKSRSRWKARNCRESRWLTLQVCEGMITMAYARSTSCFNLTSDLGGGKDKVYTRKFRKQIGTWGKGEASSLAVKEMNPKQYGSLIIWAVDSAKQKQSGGTLWQGVRSGGRAVPLHTQAMPAIICFCLASPPTALFDLRRRDKLFILFYTTFKNMVRGYKLLELCSRMSVDMSLKSVLVTSKHGPAVPDFSVPLQAMCTENLQEQVALSQWIWPRNPFVITTDTSQRTRCWESLKIREA